MDYYSRDTKDLLTKQALPGYTGFSDIVTNQGTLRNYGFEAEVRANIINKGGFTWDMNANISSVANKEALAMDYIPAKHILIRSKSTACRM